VLVTVTSYSDKNDKVIASAVTDANGMTPQMKLTAPNPQNTESPGAGIPAGLYNIEVDIEGYYPVRAIGAQVFPNITSIQPIELLPVSFGTNPPPSPISEINYDESQQQNL